MVFSKLPLKLAKGDKADKSLVQYLQEGHFPYIQPETREAINALQPASLLTQRDALLGLWDQVLIDALRFLKKHDPREWDRNRKGVNYDSFFHKGSLGVDELSDVLNSFAEFEGMLYGASPERYRDHIAHAFRVWAIGHAVFMSKRCLNGSLSAIDELGHMVITTDEWLCMWAITALCHDLGYPLSHLGGINSLTRKTLGVMGLVHSGDLRFSFSQQMLPFHDTIIQLMASKPVSLGDDEKGVPRFTTHLQNKYYLKLLKSFDGLAHGVVSSMLVSKALVYFLESDLARDNYSTLSLEDARQFLIRREILRAMAAHTCQDIYHLRFDTLPFLLYIVDEIQCWGRPTLEELQHQATGISEGEAEIRAFCADKLAVVIRTGDERWSAEQLEDVKGRLGKLHRMLRLGVGTGDLKARYLEFAVVPKKGKGVRLLLKRGKIKLTQVAVSALDSKVTATK